MAKSKTKRSRDAPLSPPREAVVSVPNPIVWLVVAIAIAVLALGRPAFAAEILRCARFDQGELPIPVPSPYPSALARADRISYAVKSSPYSVVFSATR